MNIVILQSQCQDVQEMPSQYERSCVKYDNTLNQFSIHTITNIYALMIIYMYAYCSSVAVLYISVIHSSVVAIFYAFALKWEKSIFFACTFLLHYV